MRERERDLTFLFFLSLTSLSYAEKQPTWGVLSVCADPNSMPLSNIKQEGLENKLAEVFAKDLGWKFEPIDRVMQCVKDNNW